MGRRIELGRFLEAATWTLVALRRGPLAIIPLLDSVRALDGPVGPGTLLGAVARLERLRLVERTYAAGRRVYRLTDRGVAAMAAALAVRQAERDDYA